MGKKKRKIGSIITGIGLGILLGFWVNLIYSFPNSLLIYGAVGALLVGVIAYFKPKTTEIAAYSISVFIFLQMGWDYAVGDRGEVRLTLLIGAVILLIINGFSGFYGLKKPKKIFIKALGVN